jgi:hypothetical protein
MKARYKQSGLLLYCTLKHYSYNYIIFCFLYKGLFTFSSSFVCDIKMRSSISRVLMTFLSVCSVTNYIFVH